MPLPLHSSETEMETETHLTPKSSELLLEQLLSNLLKYGVLFASTVVLFGAIPYLIRHGSEPVDYHIFHSEPLEFRSITGVITTILSGSHRGIIQLGLLLLVATPILRVVVSLLFFVIQRNWIYVTITTLVLTALVYSLIGTYI
ncbi:DUF1634 domain-containing protein [Mastigocladus laminosus UU774]|nr:MAG: DUF1634 domain-containing protein [Hapalosiphonaceae cyanobacterium JJU2]TBR60852.1 hypothetical protein B4U84_08435 [Westiellopsis prolifica IICB1]TFI56060.1 DUF1634 domain-containing protein [Mastigocladus laminosus UU774]